MFSNDLKSIFFNFKIFRKFSNRGFIENNFIIIFQCEKYEKMKYY